MKKYDDSTEMKTLPADLSAIASATAEALAKAGKPKFILHSLLSYEALAKEDGDPKQTQIYRLETKNPLPNRPAKVESSWAE